MGVVIYICSAQGALELQLEEAEQRKVSTKCLPSDKEDQCGNKTIQHTPPPLRP